MTRKTIAGIGIFIGIVLLAGATVFYWMLNNRQNTKSNRVRVAHDRMGNSTSQAVNMTTCHGNDLLTANLTNLNKFDYIVPLGNISPGGHTTPSDHIYFFMKRDGGNHPVQANIYSPGNIHIFEIDSQQLTEGGFSQNDYSIYFTPCPGVTFFLYHIFSLSPALMSVVQNTKPQQCSDIVIGTIGRGKSCNYLLDYMMKPNEQIGSVGGTKVNSFAFDFGSFDTRTPQLDYANPNRPLNGSPDQWLHITCPLDYFPKDKKTAMYKMLGNTTKRTIEPKCGSVMQDIKGTAQGNWFTYPVGEIAHGNGGEDKQLALIHNNIDPSIGEFSVGGTVTKAGVLMFNPKHNGTLNRDFGDVKADNAVYCYQSDSSSQSGSGMPLGGKILLQLVDANTLKVEYQNGSCSSNDNFQNPTTYIR